MKTKLVNLGNALALAMIFSTHLFGQGGSLEVTVKNIKEAKGTIRVGLFDNEKDFLEKAIVGKVVKATGTEVTVLFENLKPGDYGVSVIHDENENGELDKNLIGIPKEGFAFGNNAMGTFGPPHYEDAKVTVGNEKVKQAISMKYM
jgi:uncharacterized protein (DUF2141 family)